MATGDYSSLWCAGFSLWWLSLLWSTGSSVWASVVVARGLSCSTVRGILPDQGSNPCPLHWQADSFFFYKFIYFWLCWVFVAARGLSLVATSGGYSSLRCAGFSSPWLLLLWSTGSRLAGFSSCSTRAQ